MAELEVLSVRPVGEVTHHYEWGSNDITYYNGRVQKNRKKIHADRTLSFKVSGTRKMWEYLRDFYDAHRGCLDPFLFDYDGTRLQCRFADKLTFEQKRELKQVVGYVANVTLTVENIKTPYQKLPDIKRFDLPIRGKIQDEDDWNTDILDMNIKARKETWKYPVHKFTFTLSGTVKERNKLIDLYNLYGDFVPLEFASNDTIYKCFMPSVLEIVDKREGQTVVGYTANVTLTSINELQEIFAIRCPYGFLMGKANQFDISNMYGFLFGSTPSRVEADSLVGMVLGKIPSRFEILGTATVLGRELEDKWKEIRSL